MSQKPQEKKKSFYTLISVKKDQSSQKDLSNNNKKQKIQSIVNNDSMNLSSISQNNNQENGAKNSDIDQQADPPIIQQVQNVQKIVIHQIQQVPAQIIIKPIPPIMVQPSPQPDKAVIKDTLYEQISDIFQNIKKIGQSNIAKNNNLDLMIQRIVSNIQNYKSLIKNDFKLPIEQQKLIIRRFQTNNVVKLFLPHKIKNHKIIQFFSHIKQEQLNLKSIISVNFQIQKWDTQSIIKGVGQIQEKIIQKIVTQIVQKAKKANQKNKDLKDLKDNQDKKNQQQQTQMFFQFFVMIQPYVFDLLSRKIGISEFTKKVNKTIKQNKRLGKKVEDLQILESITPYDFLIVVMKMIKQKQKLGWHLDRIQCPIPIYLIVDQNKYNWMSSLLDLQMYKQCCIIMNFGTSQTVKSGKSTLLSKLFNLKEQYISNSYTIFRQKTIDIFTNLGYEIFKDKQALIADINGQVTNRQEQFKKIFSSLASKSTILIIHVNFWEIQNKKNFQLKQFFEKKKQQQLSLQKVSQIYFLIRDVPIGQQKDFQEYEQFYGRTGLQLPQQILKKSVFMQIVDMSQSQMEKQELQSQISITKTIFMKNLQNFGIENHQKWRYIKNLQQIFSQQKQKVQTCQNMIQDLQLECEGQFIQYNFPNTYNSYAKINLLNQMEYSSKNSILIPQKGQNQSNNKISQKNQQSNLINQVSVNKKIKSLSFIHGQKQKIVQSFLFQKEMSKFILRFKKQIILKNDFQSLKHVNFFLTRLKVQKTQPLRKKYIELSEKLRKNKNSCLLIQQQIKQTQLLREDFDISLLTVINQFILMNQDKSIQNIDKEEEGFIRKFYLNCVQDIDPINLIDGRTLQFGNKYLNQVFTTLSLKYQEDKNRKIYIVSVIGAQSSAKSTLLNYLFGCKFQTSAGRCTKGVYFTIAQTQKCIIVVLDTEGLLSVSGRDKCFDHQIATLIFKISNLVIINNKGELTAELRNLLDVCMYVLQNLYQTQKVEQFKPKKLFFVLRDQSLTSIQQQQLILSKITNTLGKIQELGGNNNGQQSLNYIKFFSITGQNIFSLQNAFFDKQVDDLLIQECNESFGKSILGLRFKILKALQSEQPKQNFVKFYQEAKLWWDLIMNCGKNIMNLKCLYQVKSVQKIMDKFKDFQLQIKTKIQYIFKESLKQIRQRSSKFLVRQEDCNLFSSQIHQQISLFKVQFQKSCQHITKLKDCFKDVFSRMEDIQFYFCSEFKSQYLRIYTQKKNNQLIEQFNGIISNLMNEIVSQYILNEQIIRRFQKQVENFIKRHEAIKNQSLKNLSYQSQSIMKVIQTEWLKLSESHLNLNNIFKHISQAKSLYQDLQNNKSSLRSIQKIMYVPANIQSIQEQFSHALNEILLDLFKNLQQTVKQMVKTSEIHEIQTSFSLIDAKRDELTWEFQDKFDQLKIQYSKMQKKLKNFTISRHSIKQIGRGFVSKVIDEVIISNKKKQFQEQVKKLNKEVLKWRQKIYKFITNNSSFDDKIKLWVNSIKLQLQQTTKKQFRSRIIQKLQSIKRLLNPQSILDIALSRTYLWNKNENINQKERMINCYKMIADTNKYLFQILCQQSVIKNIKTLIIKEESIMQQNLTKKIHQIIKIIRQPFVKIQKGQFIDENYNIKFVQIIAKYQIIQEKQKKKTIQIANFVAAHLEKYFQQILLEIKKKVNYQRIKEQIKMFIKVDLRNVIIGCQSLCPNCKAKCKLQKNHQGSHKVKKDCHVLSCFGGSRLNKTNFPSYQICFTKASLQSIWVLNKGQDKRVSCLQRIKQKYPLWYDHFPQLNEQHKMQSQLQKKNYEYIWANVSKMIIKYRNKLMLNDNAMDKYIKNHLQLTEIDMQREYDIPLSQQKQKLKDYWKQIQKKNENKYQKIENN